MVLEGFVGIRRCRLVQRGESLLASKVWYWRPAIIVICACDREPLIAGLEQLRTIRVAPTFGEVGRLVYSHKAGEGEVEDDRMISCHCAGSAEKTYSFGFS